MASVVGRCYAEALFEIATAENKVEVYKELIKQVNEVYKTDSEFRLVINNPKVTKDDKKAILTKVFETNEKDFSNFLKVLVDQNRFEAFNDITQDYIAMANEYLGIDIAYVTSAVELGEKELSDLKEVLENRTKRKVEIVSNIDPECIAGIRVRIKDEVIDNTIETKFNKLRRSIESTSLNES